MRQFLCATLVAFALATPPVGANPSDAVGVYCGVDVVSDSSGTVWSGFVTGGPVVVSDLSGTSTVLLSCWLQRDAATPETNVLWRGSSETAGNVGIMVAPTMFALDPSSALYLCSRVVWWTSNSTSTFTPDSDPVLAGEQCLLLPIQSRRVRGGGPV